MNKDNLKESLSIIIPVFNEEDNIYPLYENLISVMKSIGCQYEIIFINDASNDKTAQRLDELASQNELVKVIHFKINFGQTAAMMAGIDFSSGNLIIPMDGDLQNDPNDIPKLIAKLNEGYDVCSGWRKDRKDNTLKRNLPSKIANYLISKISGVHLHDYGCSLKAYKRDVIKGVKLYGEMHRFIPIYAAWQGASVTEIPVTHHPRKYGQSKYGINRTFKVILDLIVIKFLGKYAQKPIYIFGGFGLLSIFLSVLSFIFMVYLKYWQDTSFNRTPLPLLAVLFFILGFQSILMGLIAELLNRTYYESQNKPVYLIKNLKNCYKSSEEINGFNIVNRPEGEMKETNKMIETITHGLEPIALIIRAEYDEPGIQFFTPGSFSQQVAYMKHSQGHKINAHVHNMMTRQVLYTQEVLVVRRGKVKVKLFASSKEFIDDRILFAGDLILLCGGGHSFEMLEETSMIEVKQGPFTGDGDKTRFDEEC